MPEQDRPFEQAPKPDFRAKVCELFEIGLNSPDIAAYHGTTIEAVLYLAKHGRLPTSGVSGAEFFYAQIDDLHGEKEQLGHATDYAHWNGWRQYVLQKLPFKPQNLDALMYFDSFEESERAFMLEAREHGITARQIKAWIEEGMQQRKGVVLALSGTIRTEFEERMLVESNQRSIVTLEGLPIDYITGIEPDGQYEFDILEQMQQEISAQ